MQQLIYYVASVLSLNKDVGKNAGSFCNNYWSIVHFNFSGIITCFNFTHHNLVNVKLEASSKYYSLIKIFKSTAGAG